VLTLAKLSVDIPITIGNVPSNFVPPTGPTHLAQAVNKSPSPLPSAVAKGGFPAVTPQAFETRPSALPLSELVVQRGESTTYGTFLVEGTAQDTPPHQSIPPPTYEEALKS